MARRWKSRAAGLGDALAAGDHAAQRRRQILDASNNLSAVGAQFLGDEREPSAAFAKPRRLQQRIGPDDGHVANDLGEARIALLQIGHGRSDRGGRLIHDAARVLTLRDDRARRGEFVLQRLQKGAVFAVARAEQRAAAARKFARLCGEPAERARNRLDFMHEFAERAIELERLQAAEPRGHALGLASARIVRERGRAAPFEMVRGQIERGMHVLNALARAVADLQSDEALADLLADRARTVRRCRAAPQASGACRSATAAETSAISKEIDLETGLMALLELRLRAARAVQQGVEFPVRRAIFVERAARAFGKLLQTFREGGQIVRALA